MNLNFDNMKTQVIKAVNTIERKVLGGDSKFFEGNGKKGEIFEQRQDLHSLDKFVVVNAVKRVIALMTTGVDVSSLLPDMLAVMQPDNLELKKLIYLYLINYAKDQPDVAILAVNTFVTDTANGNPIVRALAIRTMGCVRVEDITEYLTEPLRRCLHDKDPYVRKTAALCVCKFYDINSRLCEDQGFIRMLYKLLNDKNSVVIASAIQALLDISESKGRFIIPLNEDMVRTLTLTLQEAPEWSQIPILEALSHVIPSSESEASQILEKTIPRLQHENTAVVLGVIKVIINIMQYLQSEDMMEKVLQKLRPTLQTIYHSDCPEIQYALLKNILLITQMFPKLLEKEMFFCQYNDPLYLKLEKLKLIVFLANDESIDIILTELKDYATSVDTIVVKESIKCIGTCALKLGHSVRKCMRTLMELLKSEVSYAVQESVIILSQVLRRYPHQFDDFLPTLCESFESIVDNDAKAAFLWILGEYNEQIDDIPSLLTIFVDNYCNESSPVQLSLLLATVKCFVSNPEANRNLIHEVISITMSQSSSQDVRERAAYYKRLFKQDIQLAKRIVLSEKSPIEFSSLTLEPSVLSALLPHLGTVASISQTPPQELFTKVIRSYETFEIPEDDEDEAEPSPDDIQQSKAGIFSSSSGSESSSSEDTPPPSPPKGRSSSKAAASEFRYTGSMNLPSLTVKNQSLPQSRTSSSSSSSPRSKPRHKGRRHSASSSSSSSSSSPTAHRERTSSKTQASSGAPKKIKFNISKLRQAEGDAPVPSPPVAETRDRSGSKNVSKGVCIHDHKGLKVFAGLPEDGDRTLQLTVENRSDHDMEGVMLRLQKNAFGWKTAGSSSKFDFTRPLVPGKSKTLSIPLMQDDAFVEPQSSLKIDFKETSAGSKGYHLVFPLPMEALVSFEKMHKSQFISNWKSLEECFCQVLPACSDVVTVLQSLRLPEVMSRKMDNTLLSYYSLQKKDDLSPLLIELRYTEDIIPESTITIKGNDTKLGSFLFSLISDRIKAQ